MSEPIHLLLIEDSANDAELILREICKGGLVVDAVRVETAKDLRNALGNNDWDIILSDYYLPAFSGLAALEILNESKLDIPFIIISGAIGEETAVQLMRTGAKDYIRKDNLSRLIPVLQRELNDVAVRQQRIAAEAALEESRRQEELARGKIDHIIRSVPDGLIVCDEKCRVVLMNHSAENLLNLSFETISDLYINQIAIDANLRKQILDVHSSTSQKTATVNTESQHNNAKKSPVIQAKTSPMKNSNGEKTGTVTILRDVTREHELDCLKNEFISTAAHELNTPLAVIIGYMDILLNPELTGQLQSEQHREILDLIYAKSLHLADIVDDLLDLSRIESGQCLKLQPEACSLASLINTSVAQTRMQFPRHRFEVTLPKDLPEESFLDGLKFTQVMENLLNNAAKYSPEGSMILIRGDIYPDYFQCTISDEGRGLAPETKDKVFEKFFRVDSSNTAICGLGLGLSIVKQIIEAHGGSIHLESELGQGTSAILTLPLRST